MVIRSSEKEKAIVKNIRNEIEASKGSYIWGDYVQSLKLISQVVFTKSSGFIPELIQNAEDAGLGLDPPGEFYIRINEERAKITHDAQPFSEEDVKALCSIRSSKRPELGTFGYLGIGFKSVFKITDCPEIYSGGFCFKFDRNYWPDPTNTPWHVLPIWVDLPRENVGRNITTFILPFREESDYRAVLDEVGKLKIGLYLFLDWLRNIEITDEISDTTWSLENLGENEEGITRLKRVTRTKEPGVGIIPERVEEDLRFKFFRRTCQVPTPLKDDRLVQEYRHNVSQRTAVIAFPLNQEGDLDPREAEAGTMYGGVYSFLPLAEASSGAKFAIQADLLVQPGREAINYEARWNHWLLQQVTDLCKDALGEFKNHLKWRFQFLPLFEFNKSTGEACYEKLFGPMLIHPLENFIENDTCVPTAEGGWAKPTEVVKLEEDETACQDFVRMALLKKEEIAPVFGGLSHLKLVDPRVRERRSAPFTRLDRLNLLTNKQFLEEKARRYDAEWFRSLYLWIAKHPRRDGFRRQESYHDIQFILTASGQLLKGGQVWIPDLPPSDPLIREVAESLQESRAILHPDILGRARSEEEQRQLRSFLRGFTGVQVLDARTVCQEALLPKIVTTSPEPSRDILIEYTRRCKEILGANLDHGKELWVLTTDGHVRAAKEVIFPKEFAPSRDWETNKQYVPGLNFVSPAYLPTGTDPMEIEKWREFFKAGGVKENPDNGVEEFAINYAVERLTKLYGSITRVEKRNFGYDLEGKKKNTGEKHRIEVKGIAHEDEVVLTGNETQAADKYPESFHLCVVAYVPDSPEIYMVPNPAHVGEKEKLTIRPEIWKSYPLPNC